MNSSSSGVATKVVHVLSRVPIDSSWESVSEENTPLDRWRPLVISLTRSNNFLSATIVLTLHETRTENTEAEGIKKGSQHFLFAMATNVQIDFGFVISAFVPLVFLYILGEGNLNGVWRGSLGLGVLFPILVLRKSRDRPVYYGRSRCSY